MKSLEEKAMALIKLAKKLATDALRAVTAIYELDKTITEKNN